MQVQLQYRLEQRPKSLLLLSVLEPKSAFQLKQIKKSWNPQKMETFTRWKSRPRGLGRDSHIDVSVLFFKQSDHSTDEHYYAVSILAFGDAGS